MDLIVGDDECGILEVVGIMMTSNSTHSLCIEWQSLGRQLKVTPSDICDLERKVNMNLIPIKEAFHLLLEIWRANNGTQSKLSLLCDALKKCGFQDIADMLLRNFVGIESNHKYGQSTIPPRPIYYIPRTLSLRTRVRRAIFAEEVKDVFVFTGIERHELSKISGANSADVSTTQTKKVTERFIQLVHEEDFDRIAAISHSSVHWIDCLDGKYYWKKSSGSLKPIHLYMHREQIKFSETDFLRYILGAFSNTPVCIGDTPGMGKSILLASIAKWVEETYPERVCYFSPLHEIINKMEKVDFNDSDSLQSWLLEKVSFNSKLNELPEVELFLDAFDEVPSDEITKCKALLESIMKLSNIRLYVTTRPHMQNDLEEVLGVLGYTILPFNEENQTDFLCQFWSNNHKAENNSKLETFAKMCLAKLKESGKENERDIAGIPLQCSLLAECYFYEAVGYSRGESGYDMSIEISSMFDMFDQFMKRKLMPVSKIQCHQADSLLSRFKSSIQGLDVEYEEKLLYNHMHLAFQLIFPNDVLSCVRNYSEIGDAHIYSVGVLEVTHGLNITRFVHRTFAEFLIAEYLVHGMDRCSECKSFLFKNALKTSDDVGGTSLTSTYFFEDEDMFHDFKYSVISYFIDCHLSKTRLDLNCHGGEHPFSRSAKKLFPLLSACTRNNLKYCFQLHLNHNYDKWIWDKYLHHLMVLASIYCHDTHIMRKLFRILNTTRPERKDCRRFKKEMELILSIATSSGSFKSVEFLLSELKLVEPEIQIDLEFLLEKCLTNSRIGNARMIANKVEILKYIASSYDTSVAMVNFVSTQFLYFRPHPVLINSLNNLFKKGTIANTVSS